MNKQDDYNQAVVAIHSLPLDEDTVALLELKALLKLQLNEEVTDKEFEALFEIQKTLRQSQGILVEQFAQKLITPEEYLDNVNALMKLFTWEAEQILGDKRFLQIFGEAGRHPEGLVDRETFLATSNRC